MIAVSAVNIIIKHPEPGDTRILGLKHHKRGKLELPGGKLEAGESIDDAALREAYEETGFDVVLTEHPEYVAVSDWKGHMVATVLATVYPNQHRLNDPEETDEGVPVWVEPSAFADPDTANFWDYNKPAFEHFGIMPKLN
jgi:8-oxo-dGTP pyrophosphatase MutT (NUDIX family)